MILKNSHFESARCANWGLHGKVIDTQSRVNHSELMVPQDFIFIWLLIVSYEVIDLVLEFIRL